MSRKFLFIVLVILSLNPIIAVSEEIDVWQPSVKQVVLAKLLSNNWVENRFYVKEQYLELSKVTFRGNLIVSDGSYTEKITDPAEYKVVRLTSTIFGIDERIILLDKKDFWSRVLFIEHFFEKSGTNLHAPVELVEIVSWWKENNMPW